MTGEPNNPGMPGEMPPLPGPPLPPAPRQATTATIPGVLFARAGAASNATLGGAAPQPAVTPTAMLGHYQLLDPIARGGMGTVLKAYHAGLDRTYALKVIQVDPQAPSIASERFLREARAVARIGKHPNIVTVHDVGQEGPYYYLAMDLVEGESLDKTLHGRPIPARRAAEVALAVAQGLEVAHAAGIIHRDLKPSNILVTREGVPQVSDFGLARDVSADQHLSQDGQILGTLQYMAPEQAAGEQARVGPATDVYGLGATLYEMITGRAPFEGGTQFAVWSRVMAGDPDPPRKANPRVHPDLETICLKAMARSPSHRYPTARAMAEDLRSFLSGEPIAARRVSLARRAWRKAVRRWPVVLPSAVAVVSALGLGAYALLSHLHTARQVAIELGIGAELLQRRQPREARDAYERALAIERGSAEAQAGIGRADAEIARLDRAAEDARRSALAAEADAKELVRKAGLVQNVLARWVLVAPTLQQLERTACDSRKTETERRAIGDALWPKVQAFIDRTPRDPTSQATMRAFAGWARVLAGYGDEGIPWMRAATRTDPDLPYGALMEAICCLAQYLSQQPLPELTTSTSGIGFGPMPRESDSMSLLRGRMSELLERAAAAKVWGEGIAQDFRKAIGSIQAMQQAKYEDAEKGLTEVLGTAAMLVFETEVVFARAKVRYLLKRFDEGLGDMKQVVDARPDQAEARLCLAEMMFGTAVVASSRGQDPRARYDETIQAFTDALDRSPALPGARTMRGIAWLWKGDAEWMRGADPQASYDKSIADFEEAGKQDRADPSPHLNRGTAFVNKARAQAARGEDARWALEQAVGSYGTAIACDPSRPDALTGRGCAYTILADVEMARGEDPAKSFEKGILDFEASLRLDAEQVAAYTNRGHLYERRAALARTRGTDPRADLDRAIADADEALKRDADLIQAYVNRGCAWLGKGDADWDAHGDPLPSYEHAIADMDAALKRNPAHLGALCNRGLAWKDKAEVLAAFGKDAGEAFDRALADQTEVLRLNPAFTQGLNNRGITWMDKAHMEAAQGKDGSDSLRKALADFDQAIRVNPKGWMPHSNRALTLETLGRYDEAVAAFETAIQLVGKNSPKLVEWRDRAKAKAAAAKDGRK